ncbi:glycyl-tRNA synthetase beta chain [Ligilactobacillus apodemi DSM 16634 = JCM 16172]|uniref:Glycine--tRNA ligase beta subunit n=1 Tax=Ligilactobacillus apodemi DSM 16634 = JCM 16172 TaxID=1423724 RepID=A0A0R1TRD4_9LACO|nr:glycine--tRNA ligase subunit beta [Ligilactobacillus apodemi]KRL83974.1 glycyl-tRNA synthetase beta chain [Ligilactobacillus apodemi DSM 16634 = JCM 16172]
MAHTYLLEIGLEEIPAHVVTPSSQQLVKKMENFLQAERLEFEKIEAYSTPRRLAVKVLGLADKQADIEEEAKGPAKKIALDAEGNWSKAAQGFSRGQGCTPDDIFFKELKGVEYAYVKKFIPGKTAKEVLSGVKDVVMDLKFPTMMRWSTNDFEYVRPIRWLVSLLDDEVVSFSVLEREAGRTTKGHRFLGKDIKLANAQQYPVALEKEMVIADAKKRQAMIVDQIEQLAAKNDWQVVVDPELLEEVNNLVEYPTVFAGSFDKKYLTIPDAVLITSMKDHQRFFYVTDQAGNLLPNFISVRNGNKEHLDNVIAGNEKVLTARLEDAAFFYEEDQKQTIADYVERLKKVMFHDKIGTIYEKMERVNLIAHYLGEKLGLSDQELADLDRESQIYKFDLVTGMVGEFSELQGVMGEIYAKLQGENDAVARAIREEYMPTSADGELPASNVGAVLSLADKIDSIQAFFSAGMLPSGSNDPYALRRQALGIVRIALDKNWALSTPLLQAAVRDAYIKRPDLYEKIAPSENKAEIRDFIADRVQQILTGNLRHDVLEAVMANKDNAFTLTRKAADSLTKHLEDANFKEDMEALTRVTRLATKLADKDVDSVDPALFENDSEKELYNAVNTLKRDFATADIDEKFMALRSLRQPIERYFEETMVMADDEAVKFNRLRQLAEIARLTFIFGSLDALNTK